MPPICTLENHFPALFLSDPLQDLFSFFPDQQPGTIPGTKKMFSPYIKNNKSVHALKKLFRKMQKNYCNVYT